MQKLYKIRLLFVLLIEIFYILGILGLFYPIKIFNLEFTPLLEKIIINFSFFSLFLFILIFIITLFFGRIYCSIICPMGILQEIFLVFTKNKFNFSQKNINLSTNFKNEKNPNFNSNQNFLENEKKSQNFESFNFEGLNFINYLKYLLAFIFLFTIFFLQN